MILIVEYDFDLFVMEIVRKNWNNKHCIITIFEAIGAISVLYICFYGAKGKKLSTKWDWSQRMKKVQEMASFSYPIFFPPFFLLILLKSYYFFVYEWVIWVIRFFFFSFFFFHYFGNFVTMNYIISGFFYFILLQLICPWW